MAPLPAGEQGHECRTEVSARPVSTDVAAVTMRTVPEPGWDTGASAVDSSLPAVKQAEGYIARAIALLGQVRMREAKESIEAAVAADPNNIEALKLRARMAMGGDLAAAERNVNAALMLAPLDSDLRATRAAISYERNPHAAMRDADQAVQLNSQNADALWIRARIHMHLGHLDAAGRDLTAALLIEPDYMRARTFRAMVNMQLGRAQEVIEDTTQLIAARRGDPSVYQMRATARAHLGDLAGAIVDLSEVLGAPGGEPTLATPQSPMFQELYLQRAILFSRIGREREAMGDLDALAGLGGPQAILRLQVYLRNRGFPDVPIDGKRSDSFDGAIKACFINEACGSGITRRS